MLRPSDRRRLSPARVDGCPTPVEANLYLPELALMRATSSLTVVAGTDELTTRTLVETTASMIGSKSFRGSYGNLSKKLGLTTKLLGGMSMGWLSGVADAASSVALWWLTTVMFSK